MSQKQISISYINKILTFAVISLLILITISLLPSGVRHIQTLSLIHQGDRYMGGGMYEKAINAYQKAEKINPDSSLIHYKIASAYAKARMYIESIKEFNQGINLNPKDKRIKNGLNVVLKEKDMLTDRYYSQARNSFNLNKLTEAKRILEDGLKVVGEDNKLCELLKSIEKKLLQESVVVQYPAPLLAKAESTISKDETLPVEKRIEDRVVKQPTKPQVTKEEKAEKKFTAGDGVTVISNPVTANIPSDVIVAIYDKHGSIYTGAYWVEYDQINRTKKLELKYTPITIHFKSTDPLATLPADYTFNPPESCIHTFENLILRTPGKHLVTAIATQEGKSWAVGFDEVLVYPAGKIEGVK
ncbi:MAG: tetratricopeptide repeat protein [bacterium]